MKYLSKSTVLLLPLAIVLMSCGGPPAQNPLLDEATANYERAQQDSSIVQFAPVALKEAEEALELSRELWEAKADKTDVDHYAYIAKQKTAIAQETARYNANRNEIRRAETERQRVLINMHRREAEVAEERARRAMEEIQQERAAAEEAREMARSERERAISEERQREAMQAEEQARLALEELHREREAAEEANRRAEELARRVQELEAVQTERGLVLTLGDVLFDFNQADLQPGAMRPIRDLVTFLEQYPDRNVMVEGHTDSVGSESYNLQLSERRAMAVRDELVNRGIAADRIQIRGFGMQYPTVSNATDSGRQQNRRVEVIISDPEEDIVERPGSN